MKKKKTLQETASDAADCAIEDWRRRAEDIVWENKKRNTQDPPDSSAESADQLQHELHVHQIELEMQNEELRRSHQGLEEARSLYFELYNFAPVGYLTINEEGLIVRANFTFATMVGTEMNAIIKRPFSQFVYDDDQDAYYLWLKQLMIKDALHACELRLLTKAGAKYWVRLVAILAQDAEGKSLVRAVVTDITDTKIAEDELAAANFRIEEASKAKSIFLANMSHELRTPLNSIIGFSEVLQDQLFGPLNAKQSSFVENIMNSGRHLLSLINDILDISKVEARKMELELDSINLADICKGTVAAFSEKARKQQVSLSYEFDAGMNGMVVVADGRKIKQILYNLVDNAIKFNRPQGSVILRVRKVSGISKPSELQIVVEDTGIGIAEEDRVKLFLPFSQLAQSYYDRQTGGTGLGLALTKHLVELHGGTIELQSEPGKGCLFTILMPMNQENRVTSKEGAHV